MGTFKLRLIESLDALRASASAWDDLWLRSSETVPTARAETIAQWVEHFVPHRRFCGIVVEDGGQWVAALPLVDDRLRRLVPVGAVPGNAWSVIGKLLVDAQAGDDAVMDVLTEGMRIAGWPLLLLLEIPLARRHWQQLIAATERRKMVFHFSHRYEVGQVDVAQDWSVYERNLPKGLRKQIQRMLNRLGADHPRKPRMLRHLKPHQVESVLRKAFEVEDRSWKGKAQTSVLKSPGMFEFFCRQARQLATWEQLEVSFLEYRGQPIAFQYGYRSKGTYFAAKIGYDERFAWLSPGHLLMHFLLREIHDDREQKLVDFLGPMISALAKWSTHRYPVGRLLIAPSRLPCGILLDGYKRWLAPASDREIEAEIDGEATPGVTTVEEQVPDSFRGREIAVAQT